MSVHGLFESQLLSPRERSKLKGFCPVEGCDGLLNSRVNPETCSSSR